MVRKHVAQTVRKHLTNGEAYILQSGEQTSYKAVKQSSCNYKYILAMSKLLDYVYSYNYNYNYPYNHHLQLLQLRSVTLY